MDQPHIQTALISAGVALCIWVLLPLMKWMFGPRLVTQEELTAAVAKETTERRAELARLVEMQAAVTRQLTELNKDHATLQERLKHMPTQESMSTIASRLDRLTGLLEGKLHTLHSLETAVQRHDDIIATAARAASVNTGSRGSV